MSLINSCRAGFTLESHAALSHTATPSLALDPLSSTPDRPDSGLVCVFITTVPNMLVAWGEGDSGGHVLREMTIQGLCGLVCPSRTSPPPYFTQYPSPPRSLVRDGQTSSHRHWLVVSRSTCPPFPLPPPPREQLCNRYCSNKHTLLNTGEREVV